MLISVVPVVIGSTGWRDEIIARVYPRIKAPWPALARQPPVMLVTFSTVRDRQHGASCESDKLQLNNVKLAVQNVLCVRLAKFMMYCEKCFLRLRSIGKVVYRLGTRREAKMNSVDWLGSLSSAKKLQSCNFESCAATLISGPLTASNSAQSTSQKYSLDVARE